MTVLGVDGWRGGWVGVRLHQGRFLEAVVGRSLADLRSEGDTVVGVDMPLGFATSDGHRPFDLEARRRLGRRASTIFLVPPKEVMAAPTYQDANALAKSEYGYGISAQAYALRTKIFEAIGLGDDRLVEIHPELVFADLGGSVLADSKKTWIGQQRRLRLLREAGVELPEGPGPAGRVPPDDLIDAAAVAVGALRDLGRPVP